MIILAEIVYEAVKTQNIELRKRTESKLAMKKDVMQGKNYVMYYYMFELGD